jgi:hypothetical protein
MSEETMSPPYMNLEDGTVWPNPTRVANVEWTLRYAPEHLTDADRMIAASAMNAYATMVFLSKSRVGKVLSMMRKWRMAQ